jgi:ABC-2 type transport system ATP-binding protein
MSLPVIDITNLSKYYGKTRGIEGVDLQVHEGEIFGFIGPNGAGKSTTIRLLLNLIFPSSGSARIMGLDIIRETKRIKNLVGYVPSDANAYSSMKVVDFLKYCQRFYAVRHDEERLTELSELFELDLDRKITELSMGNRKKVSIIQSLLHRPKLLIVDEPTTGLDPLMQAQFFELLRSENRKGMSVFFSSHILSEVQLLCKRVAIIKDGKIVQLEDIETLRKKQLKNVHIEFSDPVEKANFNIRGTENMISRMDNILSFMYSGDISELISTIAPRKITNLKIEEPSLEEIFMHYYQ